jgi:hypothetical protein
MKKRKGERKARLPTATPNVSFIEAEEMVIMKAVADWRVKNEEQLTSGASHRYLEEFFFRQLQQNAEGDAAAIVDIAELDHPCADHALRRFIKQALEGDRVPMLPVSVRNYAREGITRSPLPTGYPTRVSQVVNHAARDVAVSLWILRVNKTWPEVPLKHSRRRRRSAAALVGKAFGLGEAQARRIFEAREQLALKILQFFDRRALTNEAMSFV